MNWHNSKNCQKMGFPLFVMQFGNLLSWASVFPSFFQFVHKCWFRLNLFYWTDSISRRTVSLVIISQLPLRLSSFLTRVPLVLTSPAGLWTWSSKRVKSKHIMSHAKPLTQGLPQQSPGTWEMMRYLLIYNIIIKWIFGFVTLACQINSILR